ncbi:AAA domain-containing protein, putative AbiEii toxin, Type IV TA system [Fibrobacter sp. UWR3]|uniref:AAA family ATPase n=1 Tax=Fibrobacter sp. UWR3 TaxID=1896217 RepID=UPI0009213E00|nr:AAA family ATPase [Fibrobacter sp. UWR3]SHN04450.1 AAA domain-containing protein, putative AbiEii toxin, Type IV TA system [Fibrobacter sp. UWR3]
MQQILIQNFGPIVNSCGVTLKVNKVTVLCGRQGSGKSSIAKLISTFFWLEKALVRGDFGINELTAKNVFRDKYCAFHNIQNYFKTDTYFYFKGTKFEFTYEKGRLNVAEIKTARNFVRPQVMYIPAERNLMAALDDADKIQNLPGSLSAMLDEYSRALRNTKKPLSLPLNGFKVSYDELTKSAWLSDSNFSIKMTEAASGFQSMAPMVIVTRYLFNKIKENKKGAGLESASEVERRKIINRVTKLLKDGSLSSSMRATLIKQLHAGYFNGRLVNIVEEPEQNLYPETQRNVLNELLKVNNELAYNQLVFTTHSPYMLNYLTLAIKAGMLKEDLKHSAKSKELLGKMDLIVPRGGAVRPKDVSIYEISQDGEFQLLGNYDGVPSDTNFLNSALNDTNEMFDALLEIQDEVRR